MFEEIQKFFNEEVSYENSPALIKEKVMFKAELDRIYQSSPKVVRSKNIFNVK